MVLSAGRARGKREDLVIRSTIVGLSLVACTANPSRLEEISQQQQAEEATQPPRQEMLEMPPAPAKATPPPPVRGPAPPGLDAALWGDIGWFPGDAVDVAGFVGVDNQMMARWAADTIVPEFPACGPLVAGVERTYMVHQEGAQRATTILFGKMTRAQERACLQVVLPGLGMTGTQHEELTLLSRAGEVAVRAAWFARPEGSVVVLEGDAPLESWLRPTGTLDPELAGLIAEVDRSLGVWVAGLRDFGSPVTEVPSTGYTLATAMPANDKSVLSAMLSVRFASPREAEKAEVGARKFAAAAPQPDGVGVSFTLRADGTWLRAEVKADLSAVKGEEFMAWASRVVADLQARTGAHAGAAAN